MTASGATVLRADEPKQPKNTLLFARQVEAIERLARAKGRSFSDVARDIVDLGLQQAA